MSGPRASILVLGIGNTLLRDDGVGVHVARELIRLAGRGAPVLPPGTLILDAGTLGPDLLPWVARSRAVLLVDATDLRAAPGTVGILRGDALATATGPTSPRSAGVGELLDLARVAGVLPDEVGLVAIQPGVIDVGLELSTPVAAALPRAIAAAAAEAGRLAERARPRGEGAAA